MWLQGGGTYRAVFTWLPKVIEELVWFCFYYALWLASVFTLVLVLRQSSENRSIGGGAILPQCLNPFFPHCSSNFSAEFFSFVKEWHLQKHLSCAESAVLIEAKKCSNVQVVNFYKKVQLPVIKFVCLISTGNFLQFLLPQQKNNSNLQIYSSIYTCTKCILFCWQKCTVKCEYTCTYSGIRIRMPITTIGMRISKTVPIGLRFCWHYQEYTYILLQWYKPFINSQNLYALSIGC